MRRCKWCGKTMIVSSKQQKEICGVCLPEVRNEIESRAKAIDESFRKMQNSKTPETKLIYCDLAMEHYTALFKYEIKDIPTINPAPSLFIAEYKSLRDSILIDGAEEDIKNILTRAWRYADPGLSETEIDKAWLRIYEVKRCLHDKRKTRSIEKRIASAAKRTYGGDVQRSAHESNQSNSGNKTITQNKGLVSLRTN